MRRFFSAVLVTSLAMTAATVWAASRAESYELPNHGELILSMPEDWISEVNQSPGKRPPTISIGPKSGRPFLVLVTPIWPIGDGGKTDEATLRRLTTALAAEAQPQAVEAALPIKELVGTDGQGFYFAATDKAPKPGEYKYLAQGMIRVGEIALGFTILSNDGQADLVTSALQLLVTARHE
jgi:hypothetical protein